MAYIRSKTVKGREYLYLVKSVWNKEAQTSRQHIIKYLGPADMARISDIPKEHRNKRMERFLALRGPAAGQIISEMRQRLYLSLVDGNIKDAISIYRESHHIPGGDGAFYDDMLHPVLYEIGMAWAEGRLDIATEHLASNTVQGMLRMAQGSSKRCVGGIKVMLCVPPGEEHNIGCDVIQAYLSVRGHTVHNMGAPVPSADIVRFVKARRPDVVMVSVSLDENVAAADRLASRVREAHPDVRVIVGGRATKGPHAIRDVYHTLQTI